MPAKRTAACGAILLSLALGFVLLPQRAASRLPNAGPGMSQTGAEEPVPAFHSTIPQGPLPATMSPALFTDIVVQNAYTVAARVKKTLYQQPCYCHCDRSQGHGSLLDCFASKHASICEICIREGFYSYEQSRKGKTGAQIREGIERGDWQQVDVSKYQTALPPAK
jgi:uncharacterized protein with PCYCGC motif